MKRHLLYAAALVLALPLGLSVGAHADQYDLAYKKKSEFPVSTAQPATGDYALRWIESLGTWGLVDATAYRTRVDITICGDGTTINNNTVYYGPSQVPVANAIRTCDTTQVGNVTEATADAPAFTAQAFQVTGMDCLTADPGASGVSFTLRSAAAATVPSVTCSVANTATSCSTNIATTTAIASGAAIAIAAASAGNQGSTPFACTIHALY